MKKRLVDEGDFILADNGMILRVEAIYEDCILTEWGWHTIDSVMKISKYNCSFCCGRGELDCGGGVFMKCKHCNNNEEIDSPVEDEPTYDELVYALKDTHNLYIDAIKEKYGTHDITRLMGNEHIFNKLKESHKN